MLGQIGPILFTDAPLRSSKEGFNGVFLFIRSKKRTMSWRLAKSLIELRDQVNALWPERDDSSDGSIGDRSHAARKSDHNPNQFGVVTAIDIDADLSETEKVGVIVAALQASHDPRLKYIIWNRQITAKDDITRWKTYTGANAHQHHAHISVSSDPQLYDDGRPWDLNVTEKVEAQQGTLPIGDRVLRLGMKGGDVRELQLKLGVKADGIFGQGTEAAQKVSIRKRLEGRRKGRTVDENGARTMKELGMIFALMILGAGLIFFVKGVFEVNSKPENFQFVHFIGENSNRLALLAFGLIIVALILFLDPAGLAELSQTLPVTLRLGSPLIAGAGLAGLTLILPRKSPPALEP
jgi:hypothetical protein